MQEIGEVFRQCSLRGDGKFTLPSESGGARRLSRKDIMREVFQQSLSELQERLAAIAELVEASIGEATTAFGGSDEAHLAESVVDRSEEVDEQVRLLDELAIDILLRQQPVASDLRLVVGSLRMSSALERMSDLAQRDNAFIRPSPSGGHLGGVARATRESMLVLEAAGYDVILVEQPPFDAAWAAVNNRLGRAAHGSGRDPDQ